MSAENHSASDHDVRHQDNPMEADDEQNGMLPLLRNEQGLLGTGWEDALEQFCVRMKEMQTEHGDESVVFICSDKMTTEEMALIGAFAKFGMGLLHGCSFEMADGNPAGAMLFGNTTHLLGGHDFTNARHRRKIAAILNISEARIPCRAGWPLDRVLEHLRAGSIRALWLIGPVLTHAAAVQWDGLEELVRLPEFLVVQDAQLPMVALNHTDIYLPTSGFSRKEGSVMASNHRIHHIIPTALTSGPSLTDFEVLHRMAATWGCNRWIDGWKTPELVFQTLKKLSAGQPCDITGIRDYAHLDEYGGLPWPLPKGTV